jgi:hypothetical protein
MDYQLQSQSGHNGKEKKSFPCWESNLGCPAHNLVIMLIKLSKLSQLWKLYEWARNFRIGKYFMTREAGD